MRQSSHRIPALRNRTFVVTGASGFIGQRVVHRLLEQGARVTAFDRRPWNRRLELGPRFRFVRRDVLCLPDLKKAIPSGSIVIHLAGMTHAGLSAQIPESCFELNAHGTVRVLEACRMNGAFGFVFMSTGLVYGKPLCRRVDETHPLFPFNPYAASKLAAEAAVQAYAQTYGLPSVIARLSNVYGWGGHPDAVHTIIVRQLKSGEAIELMDLSPVRDFIHIDDVVEGLLRLCACLRPGFREAVNLSSGRGVSIRVLAQAFADAARDFGLKKPGVRQKQRRPLSPVHSLVLSNRKLLALTGWIPQISLRQGVRRTLAETLTATDNS